MKKALRNIIIGAVCTSMVLTVAGTGCGKKLDAETRPLALALGAVDGNFNPFVYNSLNDGQVIAMTQITMLTSDANGNVTCGEDEASLALDYTEVMYDAGGQVTTNGDDAKSTVYEFLIKNGVKDSMGYDIGIKDALFNLYVYLDPVYTGSSTIYSTKIKGLASYRAQDPFLADNAEDSYADRFSADVKSRIQKLKDYDKTGTLISYNEVKADIKIVSEEFRTELESDWTANEGTVSSYKDYTFTEDWEVYLFNQGIIRPQYFRNSNGNPERLKDNNGKYLTTLDPKVEGETWEQYYTDMTELRTSVGKAADKKQAAINVVFNEYFTVNNETKDVTVATTGQLNAVLTQWATGTTIEQKFLNDEMTKYSENLPDGELKVKEISGITTHKTKTFNKKSYDDEHDVLTIEINGVDPAAIYNYAFTVAPMHYYSGSYGGVDYVARANEFWNESYTNENRHSNRFGVLWGNSNFFENVVDAESKKEAPVGAGPYKMHSSMSFWNLSRAAYERNTYFTTLGSGIDNAKIKYLNYQVTTDDKILSSLKTGSIDYGEPNCTPDNIGELEGQKHLSKDTYLANGFGYVGINPTYVPELEIRQAIMLAMNPKQYIIASYYTSKYASMLYLPTSKTSFIPQLDKTNSLNVPYTTSFKIDGSVVTNNVKYEYNSETVESEVKKLMAKTDYRLVDGVYTKGGKPLKLTFTIAGETQDHPAWKMFTDARDFLNGLGFDITVKTDRNALISLATGKLQVWAAAWSSGTDPDMYQVYHKDSKATSVKNWGYPAILNDSDTYWRENAILDQMSKEIDAARSTNIKETRTVHYVNALKNVMDLAIELPTYQRNDLAVYNKNVIDAKTLNSKPSANAGLISKIWEVNFV